MRKTILCATLAAAQSLAAAETDSLLQQMDAELATLGAPLETLQEKYEAQLDKMDHTETNNSFASTCGPAKRRFWPHNPLSRRRVGLPIA